MCRPNVAVKRKIRKISKRLYKGYCFTNGVYDLLHKGHLDLLKFSKKIGKYLVVGINSDKSVKLLKGKIGLIITLI